MKQLVAVICIALVSVGAAVASTDKASKKAAWTETKAERFVLDDATVRLATEDRVALEAELRPAAALYKALALESSLTGYITDANAYYELSNAYSRALSQVRRGLAIDSVDCMGSGVAATGLRFSTFRCNVVSKSLEIPSGRIAEPLVQEEPRSFGPINAELDVRVTGTSSFAWRKL